MESKEIIESKGLVEEKNILQRDIDLKEIFKKDLNIKEALMVIGLCLLTAAYIVVFISPKYSEYKSSVAELEGIKQKLADYESEISTLPALENQLSRLENEVKVEKRKLSHNMEDGMFLVGLSNLINSLDIDMVSYTMDETIAYNDFYAIPTTIELRGDYNYIRRVMNYLEEQKNTTQVLDYNMATYIEEPQEQEVSSVQTRGTIANSVVYWTESCESYHRADCTSLKQEQEASGNEILSGTVEESGKDSSCEVCKPYTLVESSNENVETSEPIAEGDVIAKFKFIMYSTENPSLGLNNSDVSRWKPGKYNPFRSTSR